MRFIVWMFLFVMVMGAVSSCSKRQGTVEGHVDNLGMVDQSDIEVQLSEAGIIAAEALTDGQGNYYVPQIDPSGYEAYLEHGDPGPGTPDTLESSTRVRWRRSPAVEFIVEGGLVAEPEDLTRYTLYQARLTSNDALAGFLFTRAANKQNALVAAPDSADIFVTRNGNTGVSFGTVGHTSILDIGTDSLGVRSAVPGGGFQETYSFALAADCIGNNYVVRCRNGRYAKLQILNAGVDSPAGDTLSYGYITFLSFHMLTDSTHFPAIPHD